MNPPVAQAKEAPNQSVSSGAGISNDLFDVFNAPATTSSEPVAQSNDAPVDPFAAFNNPLATNQAATQ